MNQHLRTAKPVRTRVPPERPTTQAAEGVPRIAWTTADLLAMLAAGILHEGDRLELIEGEIVPMPSDGRPHGVLADEIAQSWFRRIPAAVGVSIERQFNLLERMFTCPDLTVRPSAIKMYDLRGPDALLIVEVADSSLAYDTDLKAHTYARYGVREYWVVNAVTLMARVHTGPSANGYASSPDFPVTATLVPHLVPELTLRLADLDLA